MKIVKQGKVVFEGGKITKVSDFIIHGDDTDKQSGLDMLEKYVNENYVFKGKEDNIHMLPEPERGCHETISNEG